MESDVILHRGSRRTLQHPAELGRDGAQIVVALAALRVTRGTLSPVLLTEAGSAYRAEVVERYLEAERMAHPRNLPHTPQHNASNECATGELKQASGLTSATPLASIAEAHPAPDEVRTWLEEERPRDVLGGETAAARDAALKPGYSLVERDSLYPSVRAVITATVQDKPAGRARPAGRNGSDLVHLGAIRDDREDPRRGAPERRQIGKSCMMLH